MSKFDNFNTSDRKTLERMSTEELNELLRASAQPDSATDETTILLVLEVLEQREATEQPDEVDAAWQKFERKYLAPAEAASEESEPKPAKAARTEGTRKRKPIARVVGIAAAVALVIFAAGSLITPVEGTNLWTVIANWTKETLGIGTEGEKLEASVFPEQLADLRECLKQYKLAEAVSLPTYIPDGYVATNTLVDEREDVTVFVCQLENGVETMVFQYRCWKDSGSATETQKNLEDPEEYVTKEDQVVYIVKNMDLYNAVWVKGDIECAIYGVFSKEELIKILNSL